MRTLDRIAGFIIVTVLAIGIGGLAAGKVLLDGPSEALNKKAKYMFLETRRFTMIPYIYMDADEVAERAYVLERDNVAKNVSFDPNLIKVGTATTDEQGRDKYGLVDDDKDGIIYHTFTYKGSTVYMLITLDPSRVFVGSAVEDPTGYGNGQTLDMLIEKYDAIGGINAGGFVDVNGAGSGWPPDGIMYGNGVCYNPYDSGPIAAICDNGTMLVGYLNYEQCEQSDVRDAVTFGPILIINGQKVESAALESGINPRTAIGQREDGAIVMMCVDGRQAYSLGLSFADCADILYNYGCVNALNMDGGNSTAMYFNGQQVNHSTNQAGGSRYLPEAWLIRKN